VALEPGQGSFVGPAKELQLMILVLVNFWSTLQIHQKIRMQKGTDFS